MSVKLLDSGGATGDATVIDASTLRAIGLVHLLKVLEREAIRPLFRRAFFEADSRLSIGFGPEAVSWNDWVGSVSAELLRDGSALKWASRPLLISVPTRRRYEICHSPKIKILSLSSNFGSIRKSTHSICCTDAQWRCIVGQKSLLPAPQKTLSLCAPDFY